MSHSLDAVSARVDVQSIRIVGRQNFKRVSLGILTEL